MSQCPDKQICTVAVRFVVQWLSTKHVNTFNTFNSILVVLFPPKNENLFILSPCWSNLWFKGVEGRSVYIDADLWTSIPCHQWERFLSIRVQCEEINYNHRTPARVGMGLKWHTHTHMVFGCCFIMIGSRNVNVFKLDMSLTGWGQICN